MIWPNLCIQLSLLCTGKIKCNNHGIEGETVLTLDFSYGEDFSNDEGDRTNKMIIIIIG